MKKPAVIFFSAVLAMICILGCLGINILKSGYMHEMETVYNIAGNVLTKYPMAEGLFISSLNNNGMKTDGEMILSKYGYNDKMNLFENSRYRKTVFIYLSSFGVFFVLILTTGFMFFINLYNKNRHKEEYIHKMLDKFLSDNYSCIYNDNGSKFFSDTDFHDTLIKMGKSLQIKTENLLEERDNTKTLVTDISHQLKTPIAALKTCFSMYVDADNENEKEEFFKRSNIQINKLEQLAASLINISRLETSMIQLQKEKVSLTEILVGALNGIYHKAIQKNIEIITEDFDDTELFLDKKWTVEALINILDNAVKYSPQKSNINIRIQKMYSFVRLEVEDGGIGIPGNEKNKIFTRFYRGANDVVKETEGSGVGLYLTRKILEEQGGTVSVRDSINGGSIFVVQLSL